MVAFVRYLLLLSLLMAGCHSSAPPKKYELRGDVVSVDERGKVAAIKHEAIGDWMGAMTMDFKVRDDAEFAKLKAGLHITGTVFVLGDDYWLGEIRPAP